MKTILLLSMLMSNVCYAQTGLTIGTIRAKIKMDTVVVLAVVRDQYNVEDTTVIYNVLQHFKWTQQGTKPVYYSEHVDYLGRDKKPLSKGITVLKELKWK